MSEKEVENTTNDKNGRLVFDFKIETEFNIHRHAGEVNAVLLLHNRYVVSGGNDNQIYICDRETKKYPAKISDSGSWVNHLMKFSEDSFYVACDDWFVLGYELDRNGKYKQIFRMKLGNRVSFLCKLTDSKFVAVVYGTNVEIVDAKANTVEKFNVGEKGWYQKAALSNHFESSFYVSVSQNSPEPDYAVKLVNFETGEITKIFNQHENSSVVGLDVFKKQDEELLLISNTTRFQYKVKITIYETENCTVLQVLNPTHTVLSLFAFEELNIFVSADTGGCFEFFSVDKSNQCKSIFRHSTKGIIVPPNVNVGKLYEANIVKFEGNSLTVCTASGAKDVGVHVVKFKRCILRDADENERVGYLVDRMVDLERSIIREVEIVCLKIGGLEDLYCCRVLFLL